MNPGTMPIAAIEWARTVGRGFFGLIVLDAVAIGLVQPIRDAVGRVDDVADLTLRLVPDLLLLACYGWCFLVGRSTRRFVLVVRVHSAIFCILGMGVAVPWIGPFVALLTPISLLYYGALLWMPNGYSIAILVAILFAATNAVLGIFTARGLPGGRVE